MRSARTKVVTRETGPEASVGSARLAGVSIAEIVRGIKDEGEFTLASFGTFTIRKEKAGQTMDPHTGEPVKVKAGKTIRFKASPGLQAAIADPDDARLSVRRRVAAERNSGELSVRAGLSSVPNGLKVDPDVYEPDPRARALLRGAKIAEEDLKAAGGAFDLRQVQLLMHGISRQRIEQIVREKALLAVPGPSNRRRYPTIQFNADGSVVRGLRDVQEALDFSNPWSVLSFLANPDDHLGKERPIDLLRRGELELVLESARRVGMQGA